MKINISHDISKIYPGFCAYFIAIENIPKSRTFELTYKEQSLLNNSFDSSLKNSKIMSEFYINVGSKRRCHIETLLNAYRKDMRFKSINYVVDLIYFLELSTGLLMGIHDSDLLGNFIDMFITDGSENYEHITGKKLHIPPNSICLRDESRIFASLTDGPDGYTKVTKKTQNALLLIFIPPNMETLNINTQLSLIKTRLKAEGLKMTEHGEKVKQHS